MGSTTKSYDECEYSQYFPNQVRDFAKLLKDIYQDDDEERAELRMLEKVRLSLQHKMHLTRDIVHEEADEIQRIELAHALAIYIYHGTVGMLSSSEFLERCLPYFKERGEVDHLVDYLKIYANHLVSAVEGAVGRKVLSGEVPLTIDNAFSSYVHLLDMLLEHARKDKVLNFIPLLNHGKFSKWAKK